MKLAIFFIIFILFGCDDTKYSPEEVEECMSFVQLPDSDRPSSCYCIDNNINENNFDELLAEVYARLYEHPDREDTLISLENDKARIVKEKDYSLPLYYCRARFSVTPDDRNYLRGWAEDMIKARIKLKRKCGKKCKNID